MLVISVFRPCYKHMMLLSKRKGPWYVPLQLLLYNNICIKRPKHIPYCIKLSYFSLRSNQQRHANACLITSLCFVQLAMQALVIGALRSIFIFVPFFAFQAYGYLNICVHGSSEELRPWCKAKVPLLYGFIQSHYW